MPNEAQRTCFIHIGTHKTGTTSVQKILSDKRSELAGLGIHYPHTGIPPGSFGHHNIAWELLGDALGPVRFRAEYGSVDQLLAEVGTSTGNVVLSSEDFSALAARPEAFRAFIQRLKSAGFCVAVVIYFRNQIDYLRSMYLELLKHGLTSSFEALATSVIERNEFRLNGQIYKADLDYHTILPRLLGDERVELIVRSYDAVARRGLIADFFSILGVAPARIGAGESLWINGRQAFPDAFGHFFRNRLGRAPTVREMRLIQHVGGMIDGSLHVAAGTRRALMQKHAPSNRIMADEYAVALHMEVEAQESEEHAHLEDVYSVTAVNLIEAAGGSFGAELDALMAERDALVRANGDLAAGRDQLAARHAALSAEHENFVREISGQNAALDLVMAERDALAQANGELKGDHAALAARHDALMAEHQALVETHQGLISQRDEILASRSWQITRPLRAVRSWLG